LRTPWTASVNSPGVNCVSPHDMVWGMNRAPMVGYRVQAIFYILWLDRDFTLYDHGS
jgi:hypothetical protein